MLGMRYSILAMLAALGSMPAVAQQAPGQQRELSPERKADTEALRALTKPLPTLPMHQVELAIDPPMTLAGYSAAAADQQGNIYVIHRPTDVNVDPVVVLDANGHFLRSWGKGMYSIPHAIRIDPTGNVWTVDAHTSMIYKFTPEGNKLLEISVGDIPNSTQDFCGATDVTFGKSGQVYVSDGYCNSRIIEYSAAGEKVREWGKRGRGPGEFIVAHDVSMSPDGKLFVADRENGRLQWFDLNGKYLGEKKFGGQLYSVAVTSTGDVYVGTQPRGVPFGTDAYVVKFDPATGQVLGKFQAAAHQLTAAPDGTLLPGIRVEASGTVLLLRPRK